MSGTGSAEAASTRCGTEGNGWIVALGAAADRSQAEAIRYLVSSAVAGRHARGGGGDRRRAAAWCSPARRTRLTGGAVEPERAAPRRMRANIQRLLEARVGAGQGDRRGERRRRHGHPDHHRAHHRPGEPGRDQLRHRGELGERPGGGAGGDGREQPARWRRQRGHHRAAEQRETSRERQNYEISETKRERVIQPGQIRKITSRSWSTGSTQTGEDGKDVGAPRPQEEIDTLRQLVQSAIGFDAERGDTVTIESLQFILTPEQGMPPRARLAVPRRLGRAAGAARRARGDRAGADLLRTPADGGAAAGDQSPELTGPREFAAEPRARRSLFCRATSSICRRRP